MLGVAMAELMQEEGGIDVTRGKREKKENGNAGKQRRDPKVCARE